MEGLVPGRVMPGRRGVRRSAIAAAAATLVVPLLLAAPPSYAKDNPKGSACSPSNRVLRATPTKVAGLSTQQVKNAVAIINEGAKEHVKAFGQTVAVMTALEQSSLTSVPHGDTQRPDARGLFRQGSEWGPVKLRMDPSGAAKLFYQSLLKIKGWQNLPPTLAAHAAQGNLDPNVYSKWWSRAQTVVNDLTTGTGAAGLRNLAAAAQAVANCEQATNAGHFAVVGAKYVGPYPPDQLLARAQQLAAHGGNGWFDACQAFVAILDGKPQSGYATALDAWHTFEAQGVAHAVTSKDGVAPPPGAWLYYESSNPAGHVATYLGNGMIASTDVFGTGRVGVGPARALTDGPWHLRYLGWAPPWGNYG